MAFDWSTLALQTINVVVLIWLLQRFLYRPVLRLVDARRASIAEELKSAAEARAAVDAERAAVVAERAAVAEERMAAMAAAGRDAERVAADRAAAADAAAQALLDDTRIRLAREREEALAGLHGMALDLGAELAGRLLASVAADRIAEFWLVRVEDWLAAADPAERARLSASAAGSGRLRVATAHELPPAAHAVWRSRIAALLGGAPTVAFEVEPELVGGVVLTFPGLVVDLSLRGARAAMQAGAEADVGPR